MPTLKVRHLVIISVIRHSSFAAYKATQSARRRFMFTRLRHLWIRVISVIRGGSVIGVHSWLSR